MFVVFLLGEFPNLNSHLLVKFCGLNTCLEGVQWVKFCGLKHLFRRGLVGVILDFSLAHARSENLSDCAVYVNLYFLNLNSLINSDNKSQVVENFDTFLLTRTSPS